MDDVTAFVTGLQDAVAGAGIEPAPSIDLHPTLYVTREHLQPVLQALRDRPEFAFTILAEVTAADYWPREPRFEVVYMLVAPGRRQRVRIKVRLQSDQAVVATMSGVWASANWLEREVWDMFGIQFDGHPDPRRLLMPEDWEGYPLRKDYPVQITMRPRTSEPMQVTEAEFRANLVKDRLVRQP